MSETMNAVPVVRQALGHWLYCERCRDGAIKIDPETGDMTIKGIVVPDYVANFHRDNTLWFQVVSVGPKVGTYRKGMPNNAEKVRVGDLVLAPVRDERWIKRIGENEAFIDADLPLAIVPGEANGDSA